MKPRMVRRTTDGRLARVAALCLAGAAVAWGAAWAPPASAAAEAGGPPTVPAEPARPPSAATHRIAPLCAAPSPGRSGCLGLRLVPDEPLAVPNSRAVPQTSERSQAASGGEPGLEGDAAASEGAAPASEGVPPGEAVEHKSPIAGSLTPANVLSAYGLTGVTPPSTQTIALVDAYDDATAEADLKVFDERFGLPACTASNGCFTKVNENGAGSPLPASSGRAERGWAQEIATDVEVAHGVCPSCRILLVEASSNENSDLYTAEQTAVRLGANEISNSWGGEEPSSDSAAFNHPGIVITAAAGDEGYLDWLTGERFEAAQYPASSPHVIGVGGTRLQLSASGAWEGESVWNDGGANGFALEGSGAGGGGCSKHFAAPAWQRSVPDWSSVGCETMRAVADVAADADPYSGVAVYDSTETPEGEKGWGMIGGTSVASPIIASAFALAGGARGVSYPAQTLYENLLLDSAALHDVTAGSNGECLKRPSRKTGAASCTAAEEAQTCAGQAICLAGSGYDGPTGVGTPAGINAFLPLGEHFSEGAVTTGESPAPVQTAPGSSAPGASGGGGAATPPASAPSPAPAAAPAAPAVLALALTRGARAATAHRPALSRLAFAFTLNVAARLRATLAVLVTTHGHARWRTVTAPSFLARAGAQTHSLSGRAALAAGRYRLTLAPIGGGRSRTLAFTVR